MVLLDKLKLKMMKLKLFVKIMVILNFWLQVLIKEKSKRNYPIKKFYIFVKKKL
jgi:hypothetical protein